MCDMILVVQIRDLSYIDMCDVCSVLCLVFLSLCDVKHWYVGAQQKRDAPRVDRFDATRPYV